MIIDIPRPELLQTEPRIHNTEIFVVDDANVKTLDQFTPLAKALRSRITPDWALMIVSDQKHREKIKREARSLLFD